MRRATEGEWRGVVLVMVLAVVAAVGWCAGPARGVQAPAADANGPLIADLVEYGDVRLVVPAGMLEAFVRTVGPTAEQRAAYDASEVVEPAEVWKVKEESDGEGPKTTPSVGFGVRADIYPVLMPKVTRAAWRVVFWLSAAVLLLSLGVTIISLWRWVPVKRGSNWEVSVYRGGLAVTVGLEGSAYWDYQVAEVRSRGGMFWTPRWTKNSQAPEWCVAVPLVWLVGVATAGTGASGYALKRRPRPGQCARCGYDLSALAAPGRCPECGTLNQAVDGRRS